MPFELAVEIEVLLLREEVSLIELIEECASAVLEVKWAWILQWSLDLVEGLKDILTKKGINRYQPKNEQYGEFELRYKSG